MHDTQATAEDIFGGSTPVSDPIEHVLTDVIPLEGVSEEVVKDVFADNATPKSQLEASVIELAVRSIAEENSFNPEAIKNMFIENMGEDAGLQAFNSFKRGIITGMMKQHGVSSVAKVRSRLSAFSTAEAKAKSAKLAKSRKKSKDAKAAKKRNRK